MKNILTKTILVLFTVSMLGTALVADAYTYDDTVWYTGYQSYPTTISTGYNYSYMQPGYVNPYQTQYNTTYTNSYQYPYQYQYQNPYMYQPYPYGYTNPYSQQYIFTDVTGGLVVGDEPDVETFSAGEVDGDSAELNGEVDMNDFEDGTVFFVYGQDEDAIDEVESDYDSYDEVKDDEEDDDFEVAEVDTNLDDQEEYSEEVDGLEEDEDYFYTICVEFEDEYDNEQLACGETEEFTTEEDSEGPEAETFSAYNVDHDSAIIHGEIDMNDFEDGIAFFVYGESESDVEDVTEEDSYSDISLRGDDLQKILIDTSLDGMKQYKRSIVQLDGSTYHYVRICVEFENSDDEQELECGDVKNFRTY